MVTMKGVYSFKWKLIGTILILILFNFSCKEKNESSKRLPNDKEKTIGVQINTDKACYRPGETVLFGFDSDLPSSTKIRIYHLDSLIKESSVTGRSWSWTPPLKDFTGYLAVNYHLENDQEVIDGSVAVDISFDWSRFPRYGFLSSFGKLSDGYMDSVMKRLNRYHLNGLQFYDWEYAHQKPLAGTVNDPAGSWEDIANRETLASTLKNYIKLAHQYNMKAMSYNLAYGALNDAAADGVSDQWYMYTDPYHQHKDVFSLPNPPFKSSIYFLDLSNTGWQNYIAGKTDDVYKVYGFDGYHVDQVGNRNKKLYTYSGEPIDLPTTFKPFLKAMKSAAPSKSLVMNAVNQYGQEQSIAHSPVDFLYTEVWQPNESYKDLAAIIQNNNAWSNYSKKTVLAAYMNYDLAEKPGYFNTPGVLFADAVIFAFGGAHIELGEHMLGKEYFPNDNLQMKPDLEKAIIKYYDFLVAYENLLRGSGSFYSPHLVSADGKVNLNNWPPASGSVSVIGKQENNLDIIHLINFTNVTNFDWRDKDGTRPYPANYKNISLTLRTVTKVKKVWFASPDYEKCIPINIPFKQSGNSLSFNLPSLQYWDMIVIEH